MFGGRPIGSRPGPAGRWTWRALWYWVCGCGCCSVVVVVVGSSCVLVFDPEIRAGENKHKMCRNFEDIAKKIRKGKKAKRWGEYNMGARNPNGLHALPQRPRPLPISIFGDILRPQWVMSHPSPVGQY